MTFERIYTVASEQGNALTGAADPNATRTDMASLYADCIIADRQAIQRGEDGIDWPAVSKAILARWSHSGLAFIKTLAWKQLAEGRPS